MSLYEFLWPLRSTALLALLCVATISGVRAQSLSVYIDNVLYSSGSSVSCRPGATLLFQCEYLGADQSLVSPFPPSLCSLTSGNCRALQPISSPPWASGKLRANYTISGVISGTQSYGCLYRSPPTQSSVTITFTNSSVYPSNSNCVTGSATAATSTTSLTTATTTVPPTTTTITTFTTATTKPSTSTSTSASTSTTTSASSTSKGTPSRTSPPSTSTTSPADVRAQELTNPLIYMGIAMFLLGVLTTLMVTYTCLCWRRRRRRRRRSAGVPYMWFTNNSFIVAGDQEEQGSVHKGLRQQL